MNGAQRILNVMKKINQSGQNTTSDIVSLTVKSTEPLIFENENRLTINSTFYSLSKVENWSNLKKGDIVRAFKMNNGQSYYINEILEGNGSSDNIKNLEDSLIDLTVLVSQLSSQVNDLEKQVKELNKRVETLEGKVG